MKIRSFLSIVLITAVVGFFGIARAYAFVLPPINLDNDSPGEGHVNLDKDHEFVSVCHTLTFEEHTVHITVSMEDEVAAHNIAEHPHQYSLGACEEPTPSPSDTPTPTPTQPPTNNGGGQGVVPSGNGSTTNPPGAPSCTIPFSAPILAGGRRVNNTTVQYHWWKSQDSGVDFQAIVFGYSPSSMNMGDLPIDKNVTQLDVTQLHSKQPVFAQIWAFKGGCASISNTLEIK